MMDGQNMHTQDNQSPIDPIPNRPRWSWRYILTLAGLVMLGITPWASAQAPQPNMPAYCPPLTAIANPSLFDVFWGTTPIRFPYQ
jgi:hypothetical protein